MSQLFEFPGDRFPQLPGVSLTVPPTWAPVQPSGALLAAVRQTPAGTFQPNVVVSVTRFNPEHSLETTINALKAQADSYPECTWGAETRAATGAGPDAYQAELSYVDPRAGTLVQHHHMVLVDRGSAKDLVHAVGSCAAAQVNDVIPELRAVLTSMTVIC